MEWAGPSGKVEPGRHPNRPPQARFVKRSASSSPSNAASATEPTPIPAGISSTPPAMWWAREPTVAAPDEIAAVEVVRPVYVLVRWAGLGPDGIFRLGSGSHSERNV